VNARLPISAESLNRGLVVAAIKKLNNVIPVPRALGRAGKLFGPEQKALMDELLEVLVT